MDELAAEQLIMDLYENALGRLPGPNEFKSWVKTAVGELPPEKIIRAFYSSAEFKIKNSVRSAFPLGHFHSPLVDPDTVRGYVANERNTNPSEISGIAFDIERMRAIWLDNLTVIKNTPFTDHPSKQNRYCYLGGPFSYGDAITLRMMIHHYRPKRIVEIGSGYSSACMLDSAEHAGLSEFHLVCVEPNTKRLRSFLRRDDFARVKIIEKTIQEVPVSIVDDLGPNDFLFIDSTHVMKTGSDVHYELFHLLPRLKIGVVVHFHDVHFPFEYPDDWIFELNHSWNEAYALRAFLMFNTNFRVSFWDSLFAKIFADSIRVEYPTFLRNSGGSIWIERAAS
jgi:predicted O-methyltransferase YrrM